jgi:hypothetical protein
MKEYKINIDVFCHKHGNENPVYRIYLDGDLITERTYIWSNAKPPTTTNGQFVKENIWVNLTAGNHEVKLESLDPSFRGFYFTNLMVDDIIVESPSKGRFVISE